MYNMKLIADSGSTKTDWALLQGGEVLLRVRTEGLNPNTTSSEKCNEIIAHAIELMAHASDVKHIYFYGAGCAGEEQKKQMTAVLNGLFPQAATEVASDLYGAVYAVASPGEACVTGILGTGANSCYFDGTTITGDDFSLGFILGDEGSGSWLGKQLLSSCWYGEMPEKLQEAFTRQFSISRNAILQGLYQGGSASAYLASFAAFAVEHRAHPYIRNMIDTGFSLFISRYLNRFSGTKTVHMIGGIACALEEEFRQNALRYQWQPGVFLKEPITGLIKKLK